MDPTPSGPPRLRTSDAEREQVAAVLRTAMSEGRLTLTEGDERLGAAYGAVYRDELVPLTADLPGGGRAPGTVATVAAAAPVPPPYRTGRRRPPVPLVAAAVVVALVALSGGYFLFPLVLILIFSGMRHARHGGYHHAHHGGGPRWAEHRVAPWNGPGWR